MVEKSGVLAIWVNPDPNRVWLAHRYSARAISTIAMISPKKTIT